MKFALALAFGLFGICLLVPVAANAQATRTWVSGTGDDANPCSRTAPCKTFAGAISKTSAAGQINCLDPAGFGALTITKSISIKCDANAESGVLVSGTNGFVVAAATTDVVWISGLDFEGLGPTASSLNGIKITSAAEVTVSNCTIRGFGSANGTDGNGIFWNATNNGKLIVVDSLLADNALAGMQVQPQSGTTVTVDVSRTIASNNQIGFHANGGLNPTSINMSAKDSTATLNTGAGFKATAGTGTTSLMLNQVVTSFNNTGLTSNSASAVIRVGASVITGNVTATSGAGVQSYGNNQINGNTTDTIPPAVTLH